MTKSQHKRRKEKKPRVFKSKDGFYRVGGKKYSTLIGSREDVLNGIAYKTKGGLRKKHLTISKNRNEKGKAVSLQKSRTNKHRSNLNEHNKEKIRKAKAKKAKTKADILTRRRQKVPVRL